MKKILPSQQMQNEFFSLASTDAPLSEAIRLGAQLMLQKTAEMEVTGFLGREHYQRSSAGVLRGYRNGYQPKSVQTAEGTLHLKLP